ncbi:MAG: porin family protein [Gammaproteobacteria bacterium]|nr:porin family protein [Gammaproteobacteria bacterium]
MTKQIVFLVTTMLATTLASSEEFNVEITPLIGYRFSGDFEVQDSQTTVDVDDSASFGFLINVRNDANTTWELLYSQQRTDAQLSDPLVTVSSVDTDIHVLQLGGTYHGDGDKVQPYVAMTIGGTHISTDANGSQNDTFFSGSIGLGINVMPSKRFGLRLEARAYGTLTDSETDLFCRTGPDINLCAIRIESNLLGQFETFAGFRFSF